MKSSFAQVYIHLVFAPKERLILGNAGHREELGKYMAGIVANHKSRLYIGKVMPDHVHLLIGLHPGLSVSAIAREIKASSSKLINDKKWVPGKFNWCEGYGAFSCSHAILDKVAHYIQNQEIHHSKVGFGEEYKSMLKLVKVSDEEMENYHMA